MNWRDKKVISGEEYKNLNAWGLLTSIDLSECNPKTIRNKEEIKRYIIELCDLIEMKRFGEPIIVNFGEDIRVAGFSMAQLIETSLISGHFADQSNSVYIDIFSCKFYEQKKAVDFTKNFFKAKKVVFEVIPRGIGVVSD